MKHRHKHIKSKLRNLRPKKWFFKQPMFWICFLMLLLASGAFYLFFFFPKFQVQAIIISGNTNIPTREIEILALKEVDKTFLGVGYKNIFAVDATALKKHILTGFAGIEDVVIKKQWFENILVQIIERKPFAVFCPGKNNEQCFVIDRHGVIYETAQPVAEDSFIVRQYVDETKLTTGQALVDLRHMEAIIKIKDSLEHNFQINVKEVLSSNPLIMTTSEGWQIHLDPALDIDMQVSKLNLLLKNEIAPEVRKNLQYIYLQYKDRAYYK